MQGLPVNTAFDWRFQTVVDDGNNRKGFNLQGSRMVVGSTRTWSFSLGASVGEIEYGNGHIVFSDLKIADNLLSTAGPAEVAKKLFINYVNYSPAGYFEGWTPDRNRRPFRDNVIPGTIEAEDFDYGGEGVAYHYGAGESQRQEAMDKNASDGKGRDYVYRTEWVRINREFGAIQNLSGGDWFEYTVNVLEDGDYQLESMLSTGGSGNFHLYIDGVDVLGKQEFGAPDVAEGVNTWDVYSPVISKPISLKAGKHIFRFGDINGLNPEKFTFTRIGDYGSYDAFDNDIPGKVEAENYLAGQYVYGNSTDGSYKQYRKDQGVAISKEGDVNGKHVIYLGYMSTGDSLAYEFNCTEAGKYEVLISIATIGTPKIVFTLDGVQYGSRENPIEINKDELKSVVRYGGDDWTAFGLQTLIPEIRLEKGPHTMSILFTETACNFDGIVFNIEPEDFALTVPGKIEAEHYDEGYGNYFWANGKAGSYKSFRRDKGVAIDYSTQGQNGDSPDYADGEKIVHLSWTSNDDFLTYTFECTQDGNYDFHTCVATTGDHKYYITVDGVDYGSKEKPFTVNTGLGEWQQYKE